jgi:hypothetical protein
VSTGGWINLLLSVGSVTVLFGWCIYKVVSTPEKQEKLHGFEFETPDEKAEREED